MNLHDETHARESGWGGSRPRSVKGQPASGPASGLERWWLPGVSLVFAVAGLTLLILKTHSKRPPPPDAARVENERKLISSQAATNAVRTSPAATNIPPAGTSEDLTVRLVAEGNALLQAGNVAEAARRYEQAVRADPEDEDLHYNLGIALARLGKIEEAKRAYEEALRIFPDYEEAHNNLGNLLMNQGKLAEAIAHFSVAIRIMPENASAHNNLGTALGRQEKLTEAIVEFAQAVKLKPDYVEARVNLANAYLVLGQANDAVAELSEALRLQPDFQPALNAMTRARQRQSSSGIPK